MIRLDLFNVVYDIKFFLRRSSKVILISLLISVIAIIFAIVNALSIKDVPNLVSITNYNIILVINGGRSFWSFFWIKLFTISVIILIVFLLSYRIYTAIINFLLIFLFCYFNVHSIVLVIMYLKLSILPAMLICIIPSMFIYILLLCCLISYSFKNACEFQYYGETNYFRCVCSGLKVFFILGIIISVLVLIESTFAFLLTRAIII